HVFRASWIEHSRGDWYFEITADRFLRNMVRAVVGTLVDVGRGRLSLEEFKAIIESRRRSNARESMPPQALFLEDITY
ncbi:MAG: tRNA pseudouridine(38-40) synthase TruA, partial [Bacteroidales bacterium]|nr:tRNA pseudouridine(38-40) synthase TruA [Bacteroidales bacterium]